MNVGAFYLETLDHTDRIDLTDPLVTSHDMTARLEVSTTLNNTFNVVVADVVDLAQNTTTLVLTASIVLDTRPPRAPTLRGFSHLLNTTSVVINLSAEADSTTRLYVDGQTLSNSLSPNDTITLSLNEGFHYFALRSTDRAGNESLVQNDSVTIDITPAQVTTWSIEGLNILKAGQYSVTLGFSEAIVSIGSIALESSDTGFRYTVDGTGHLTITSLQDGIYDLVIQHIRDVAGNVSSVVISAALTVDTTPPDAPQFLTFAAIMNTVNFKSSFLTEEQALISVIVDGHPRPSLYQAHDDCQLTLSEGQHQVSLLAYDPAQNVSATQNYTITIDLTPPTLNKIGLGGLYYLKSGSYLISFNFNEKILSVAAVYFELSDKTNRYEARNLFLDGQKLFATLNISPQKDGLYDLNLLGITDIAHNTINIRVSNEAMIDTAPPLAPEFIDFPTITNHPTLNTHLSSEPSSSVIIYCDGSVYTNAPLTEGVHRFDLVAFDLALNQSPTQTYTLRIDLTKPTLKSISFTALVSANTYPIDLSFSETLNWTLSPDIRLLTLSHFRSLPIIASLNRACRVQASISSGENGTSQLFINGLSDLAGNMIDTVITEAFTIDTTSPNLQAISFVSTAPVKDGLLELLCTFSEPVSVDALLTLTGTTLNGTFTPPTISFIIPKNIEGQATLWLCHVTDRVGNHLSNFAPLSFNVDAIPPGLVDLPRFVASTNRGSPSNVWISLNVSEPIKTDNLGLTLVEGNKNYKPDRILFSSDRKEIFALFKIEAVEENASLRVTDLIDDFNNAVVSIVKSLGPMDNVAPIILGYGADVSRFSAIKNRGNDAAIHISLNIHEDYTKCFVRIYDSAGNIRKTLKDTQGFAGPLMLDPWDGKDDAGHYLNKGWYTLKIWAIDEAGNEGIPTSGLFEITEQRVTLSINTSPQPYSFIANGPRKFPYSFSEIVLTTNEPRPDGFRMMDINSAPPIGKITEAIYQGVGSGSMLVVTLTSNALVPVMVNDALCEWDGKISGNWAESGLYTFQVSGTGLNPDSYMAIAKTSFVVDHDPPTLRQVHADRVCLSTRPLAFTDLRLNFNLTDNSNMTINSQLMLNDSELSRGTNTSTLSFNFTNKGYLDGDYVLMLRAFDIANNSCNVMIPIKLDSTTPKATFQTLSHNGFVSINARIMNLNVPNESTYSVLYQFGELITQNNTIDTSSHNGRLLLGLILSDNAGNLSLYIDQVTVDNQIEPPRFTLVPFTATRNLHIDNFIYSEPNLDTIFVRQMNAGQTSPWEKWTPDTLAALIGNEGGITLEMKIEDMAGNISTPWTVCTILDTTPPMITSVSPSNYCALNNGLYVYDHIANLTSNWTITLSNEPNGIGAYVFSPSTLIENTNDIYITAIDRAGNVGTPYGPISIIIDRITPTLSLVNTAAGRWINGQSNDELHLTVDDKFPSYNVVRIVNANGVIVTQSNTLKLKEILNVYNSGIYSFAINAYDIVGHESNTVTTLCYLDKEPPILQLLAMDTFVDRTATLSISATDTGGSDIDHYLVSFDHKAFVPRTSTITLSFDDVLIGQSKAISVEVVALDKAGNTSNCLSKGLLIDKIAPILSLSYRDIRAAYISRSKPTLSLNVMAQDTDSGINEILIRYLSGWSNYILGQALSPYSLGYDLADGSYQLDFSVIDNAGNTTRASVNYIVDNTLPLITELTISPKAINRKKSVSINLACDKTRIDTVYLCITTQNQADRFVTIDIPIGEDFAPLVRTYLLNAISTLNPSTILTDNTYTIFLKLKDYANNESPIRSTPFIIDTTPPQINHFSSVPTLQASLDPDETNDKPIVITYGVIETNALAKHRIRVFSTAFNSDLMDIDRLLEKASPYTLRWDGWLHLGTQVRQLPEGIYFVELTLEDDAGNKTTTVAIIALATDIWIGGNNPHAPSVETDNMNEIMIRYGEGDRYAVSLEKRGSCFGQAWADDEVAFTLDLPQTVNYSEINKNDNIHDDTAHRALDYRGYISAGPNLTSYYLDMSNTWRFTPSGYYNLVVKFQGNALDFYVLWQHVVNTAWRTDRVQYYRYSSYSETTLSPFGNGTNSSSEISPLSHAMNSHPSLLKRKSYGLVGYLCQNPDTREYSFSSSNPLTLSVVQNIYEGQAGSATNISAIQIDNINHVAWEDDRSGQNKIYYRRVYTDYSYSDSAPTAQMVALSNPSIDVTTSFNLLSPKSSNGDIPILATTRPTFVWTIPSNKLQGNSHFQIDLYKGIVAGTDSLPTFDVPLNILDDHFQRIDVPAGTYKQIGNHLEFTPDVFNNLGATAANECYRWQVAADWSNDGLIEDLSLTSEIFKLDPPLDINYTLNYPNPFKTTTHIRYKLSKDAQTVNIILYNLNGKVVRTLTDCPTSGTRPYHEYQDVLWDGCNGVGDEVLNGVYIYKIVAIDEGRSKVSATGKLLKLK